MASKIRVEMYGVSGDINFMRARYCAEDIYRANPDKLHEPTVVQMLKFEWDSYINEKKKELKGEMWRFKDKALVFVDGELKGGPNDFIVWARKNHNFNEFRPLPLYVALTEEGFKEFVRSKQHTYVYMDITIGMKAVGRLVIELFSDLLPKTCANFEALCTGEKGLCEETHLHLAYVNTIFHRVVPGGWIEGGDIQFGRGNGGASIYGRVFGDESFIIRHNKRGIVGMANSGRNSNQSQFYITLQPTPWMDGRYVAFGQLVDGGETLCQMEQVTTTNERPDLSVLINNCGRLKPEGILE